MQEAASTRRSVSVMEPNFRGLIVAEAPRTRKILNMLLPMTFPIAKPGLPLIADITEVASSGREVPAATIVKPITASLTPRADAMPDAPSTNQFPPNIRPPRPRAIHSTDFAIGISGLFDIGRASVVPLFACANV